MTIREAAAHHRPDIQLEALSGRQALERLWGVGEPERTLLEYDQLVEQSAIESSPAEWAWAHCFYAPWNDPSAEENTRWVDQSR